MMRRMRRLVCLFALAFLIDTPLAAQPLLHADGPQKPAPADPIRVFDEGFSARWLEDSEFVYAPALLDFDLQAYLAASAPHLLPHADAMSHWAGYYSISPKLLLALLDMQSGVLSAASPAAMANPTGGLAAGSGFDEQIRILMMGLTVDFYAFREASGGRSTAMNAATFALLNAFRAATQTGLTVAAADDLRRRFLDAYVRLFPLPAPRAPMAVDVAAIAPANFLQLPWKHNQAWFFNGVHTQTGSDPGVMNSIDVARSFAINWGDNTGTDYVVAAHAGTVTVFSSCNVRVTAPNGWATSYYHLSNVVVSSGMQVSANDTIGVYANSLSQALCQGGHSTRPHLHFSLLQNGAFAALDGTDLGGYIVHAGRYSYDADPNYMWLQSVATGTRHYVNRSALVSTPVTPGVPGAPTNLSAAVSGLTFTLTWRAAVTGAPAIDYVLEAAGTSAFTPVLFGPASLGATTTATLTAPPGTAGTFHLRVSARNANGTSTPSNSVTATFASDTTAPGPPGTPVVQVTANHSVVVSWAPPTNGPTPSGYRVYLTVGGAPFPGSPFTLPATTGAASPGPMPPGSYSLAVAALVGAIEGPRSAPAVFVIPSPSMAADRNESGRDTVPHHRE
jgi:LasA protease